MKRNFMNGELMGIGKTYSIKLSLGNFLGALISKNPTKFRLLASEFSLTPITTVEPYRGIGYILDVEEGLCNLRRSPETSSYLTVHCLDDYPVEEVPREDFPLWINSKFLSQEFLDLLKGTPQCSKENSMP